jgi:hypothetical protein
MEERGRRGEEKRKRKGGEGCGKWKVERGEKNEERRKMEKKGGMS